MAYCLLAPLLFFIFCSQCYAESSKNEPLFYLMKALDNIEQINSGEVDIHINTDGFPSYGEDKEIACFLAFDLLEDRFFYRRSDERNEYANDGTGFYIHDTLNSHVSIQHPAISSYSSSPRVRLDPRAIGLFSYRKLWQDRSYSDCKKIFFEPDFVDISEEAGDLAFEAGSDKKTSHGYSTRQVIRISRDSGNITSILLECINYSDTGEVYVEFYINKEFFWTVINGISVLSHFNYEVKHTFLHEQLERCDIEEGLMSVQLNWRSVNQELNPSRFSYEAFDLNDRADVWDLREGKPFLVMSKPNSIMAQARKNSNEPMTNSETQSNVLFVVLANVFFLFLLALWLLGRKIYFRYIHNEM